MTVAHRQPSPADPHGLQLLDRSVAIHVGGGDSGPIVSHGIGEEHFTEQPIGETQPGQRRRQEFKTGVARSRNAKRSAPVALAIIPTQVICRLAKRMKGPQP